MVGDVMAEERALCGGPQDGSKVRRNGDGYKLPDVVYVGPKWLGDGYSAWGREKCKRFPVAYRRDGLVYRHRPRGF